MERRMPWKRMQNYLAVVVITISLSLFFSYKNRWLLDEIAAYLILDIVFLAVLLYTLERNRVNRKLGVSGSNRYGRIALCYGACCLAAIGCYFSPEFTCPAEAFALFLCLAANIEISISLSLLICMLLCVARGQTIYELAAYCILILVGAQMAHTVYKKKTRVWGCMILGSVSLCAPMLFCYLAGVENKIEVFLWKSLYLAVTIALYFAFAKRLYGKMEFDRLRSYERIIDHEYPLFQDIKN